MSKPRSRLIARADHEFRNVRGLTTVLHFGKQAKHMPGQPKRLSRVPWNFGGGPVSIRLRSPGHCARLVRQVGRTRLRGRPAVPVGAGGR